MPMGRGGRGGSFYGGDIVNGDLWWSASALEGADTVHRPRRELQWAMPMDRGDRGGSSCGGGIVNGGLWWPESTLEGAGMHGYFGERERELLFWQ